MPGPAESQYVGAGKEQGEGRGGGRGSEYVNPESLATLGKGGRGGWGGDGVGR